MEACASRKNRVRKERCLASSRERTFTATFCLSGPAPIHTLPIPPSPSLRTTVNSPSLSMFRSPARFWSFSATFWSSMLVRTVQSQTGILEPSFCFCSWYSRQAFNWSRVRTFVCIASRKKRVSCGVAIALLPGRDPNLDSVPLRPGLRRAQAARCTSTAVRRRCQARPPPCAPGTAR